jgi:DNA end-binding protein Ku
MQATWTGAISFGQISIPVRLYKASESQELSFTYLRSRDSCPIRFTRVCADSGEEVPFEDIVRGYEYQKGQYIILEEQDFRFASPRKSQLIEILSFTDPAAIDVKYLKRPYYLEPFEEGRQAYALLREALKSSGTVGITCFVMRHREHLAMLKAEGEVLVLNLMRFQGELRQPNHLDLPDESGISVKELNKAVELIRHMSAPWEPDRYQNTYIEDLKRIIAKKSAGQQVERPGEAKIPVAVDNLFERLEDSLRQAGKES